MDRNLEETLFEDNFSGLNLSKPEIDFYLQILRETKEIKNSRFGSKFELVYMSLYNEENNVRFNGATSNGIENRCISGYITKKDDGSYLVETNTIRLCVPCTKVEDKEYTSIDLFKVTANGINHTTTYLALKDEYRESFYWFNMNDYEQFKKGKGLCR